VSDNKGFQQRPLYYGYNGGFASITRCGGCRRTALYEDAHPVDPCYECGSRVDVGTGRWIKPVYKWQLGWPLKELVQAGYWEIKRPPC